MVHLYLPQIMKNMFLKFTYAPLNKVDYGVCKRATPYFFLPGNRINYCIERLLTFVCF